MQIHGSSVESPAISNRHQHEWYYTQIYLQQGVHFTVDPKTLLRVCDQLLYLHVAEWLTTLRTRGWINNSFFLRYAVGGYHIRLRVQGKSQTINQHVQPFLDDAISRFFQQANEALKLQLPDCSPDALREAGWIQNAVYEPEFSKYGGCHGIPISETHFGVSSDVAIRVISAEQKKRIHRTTASIDLINQLLHAFTPHRAEHAFILKAYTGYWLSQIYGKESKPIYAKMERSFQQQRSVLRQRLFGDMQTLHSPETDALFNKWNAHCTALLQQITELELDGLIPDQIGARSASGQQQLYGVPTIAQTPNVALLLLPNYLHMLNNRLGISPLKEAQLTHLMYRTIESENNIAVNDYPMRLEPEIVTI